MADYKSININVFGKKSVETNPDVIYWKKLGVPVFLREYGPVDYIDFSPIEPHHFAVTSSVRVQVYNPVTRLLYKNLSRFQKNAYGGSFRSDGKLLCAGGEEHEVKLFDVAAKTLLRVFKGHTGAVHRCYFTIDNTHVVSFSDDQTVTYWDIPSEQKILSFKEHSDYVRAGAVSPVSPDIILSGGYDNYVKMYDKRSESVVFNVNHGAPVESVLFLPTGGIFLSAGGTEIKLASRGSRILSGSLDRHVNVYDVATFKRLHTLDYSNAVLSLGISANDETLAVGMVDGLVSVSRREAALKPTKRERQKVVFKYGSDVVDPTVDVILNNEKQVKLPLYSNYLKKFEYSKALSMVLGKRTINKQPNLTVAVLKELIARKALHETIAGNNPKIVLSLLTFLIKNIGDYRFTRVLISVANIFLDVYEDNITSCGLEAVMLFQKLADKINEEVNITESLLALEGCINLVMSASNSGNIQMGTSAAVNTSATLTQSESGKDFVVQVN
ncbi:UNVERIFIED_CONTAM: hypothetical protein PYX00_009376 [Menopon gallinae]|uniref:U3 small nucleolar RNA-associated protein 15 homolog n=1 Tax=Menopon gallinae TaxID=328185 RepID=A0AAW2HB29_9NEOP